MSSASVAKPKNVLPPTRAGVFGVLTAEPEPEATFAAPPKKKVVKKAAPAPEPVVDEEAPAPAPKKKVVRKKVTA